MKRLMIVLLFIIGITSLLFVFITLPNNFKVEPVVYTVPKDAVVTDPSEELVKLGVIRNTLFYHIVSSITEKGKNIASGGYRLSGSMWMWQVISKLSGKPDLVWVTIPSCIRIEQVGERLAEKLGWDSTKLSVFNDLFVQKSDEFFEGILYPDTYLLPVDESVENTTKRLTSKFQEMIAPYMDEFLKQNIKWTTGLKIASLIAREAAGKEDMNLISGIIWNRLNQGMKLEIDATMQYTKGKQADGSWWGSIDIGEKRSDSPYNSYMYKGLPPTAICSPNIAYIDAVLHPTETDCIYYLHGSDIQIHCSKTYEEHLENIDLYLR
jgi:UPF0755 protein